MEIAKQRELFEAIIGNVPQPSHQRLRDEFERLAAIHADSTVTDKAPVEEQIACLQRTSALLSCQAPGDSRPLYAMVLIIFLLFFIALFSYFTKLGPDKYVLIETTRPILVFTLIIAMLGFGGALILTALFSTLDQGAFERRFRLAREIFLVYSGIFGTIIGFYFGAASGEAASANPPTLSALSVQSDGKLTARVEGGSAPFTGTIRLNGEDDDRSLIVSSGELSIQLTPAQDCPAGAHITARDADSQSAELTVQDTATALRDHGWPGCTDEAERENAGADGGTQNVQNPAGNAQTNVQ